MGQPNWGQLNRAGWGTTDEGILRQDRRVDPREAYDVEAVLEGGFPRLGTPVKQGDVLAYVMPPLQAMHDEPEEAETASAGHGLGFDYAFSPQESGDRMIPRVLAGRSVKVFGSIDAMADFLLSDRKSTRLNSSHT